MRKFQNVLIIRTDKIGDVVLTTPAIAAVRSNLPQAKITVLVSGSTKALLQSDPNIDELIVDDRINENKGWMGFWKLVDIVKQRRFDCVIIFHTKRRTNLLSFYAGIPVRIGYKDKNFGFLLTHGIKDDRFLGIKHEVDYCLDLLKNLNFKVDGFRPVLSVDPDARQFIDQWIRENRLSGKRIIAIHPGASDLTKCWPVESFARLIDELAAIPESAVVVFGAGETVKLIHTIRTQSSAKFFDLSGKTSLAQIIALLSRSHVLVSNDSGPVHVAAALGIYVVSLFLRNQPGINAERWKPFGEKGFLLLNKDDEAVVLDRSGRQVISGRKDSIKVDEVKSLVVDLISRV
ncbi:MAG: glycosyltransferase family 9 protein [Candidatus Omnitrophica bacterium]|nr:glycosyltransferase family 9 protein [Candidatus Omnitrophota bacterium]